MDESESNAHYTYLTTDLTTNRVVGELELAEVSYTRALSAVGAGQGSFIVNQDSADSLRKITVPGRTGLYVLRNGQPVHGGIIWKRAYDKNSRKVSLTTGSFESYFYHRFQDETHAFTDTDQLDIARTLINPIASSIVMTVSPALSGVRRERVMFDYEFKTRGEELELLGSLENGFDWNVNVGLNPDGTLYRRLDFGYPFLGLAAGSTDLMFEYPGNISTFTFSEDAESGGNRVFAIGGGEGEDQLSYLAEDTVAISNGFPILETSRSYKSVVQPSTLRAHGVEDLAKLNPPISLFNADVRPNDDPSVGSYAPGDYARFRISDSWVTGLTDFRARITAFTVTVSDSGGPEGVTLSFDVAERTQEETEVSGE